MLGILSNVLETAANALGLEDTAVAKLMTAAIETLAGVATGDVFSIIDGARNFASLAGEAAAKVEYFEATGKPSDGYAPSPTPNAATPVTNPSATTSAASGSRWDVEFANAVKVLRDNFDLFDTASGKGARDNLISRDDLRAILQNANVPAEIRRACTFLLQNPSAWNRLDVACGAGPVDGYVSRADVAALGKLPARVASEFGTTQGSSSATPTSSNSTPQVSDFDRKYANAVKALSDYFDLVNRPTDLGFAGKADPDGKLTVDELKAALNNPDLPPALRDGINFLLSNPAALNLIDGAGGKGHVDGLIFRSDIRCEMERVGKNAGPAPTGSGTTGEPSFDQKYANAVKVISERFDLINAPTKLGFMSKEPDGKLTRDELEAALKNPDLPQELRDAIQFLLSNPAAFDLLDGAGGKGHVDGLIFRSDLRCEMERVGKNATASNPSTTSPTSSPTASAAEQPVASVEPWMPEPAPWSSPTSPSSSRTSRFAGMTPEEIVNAILLDSLGSLDDQMVDLAKQLESAQNAQSGAERGSNDEKKATNDVNRLQFKLQQVAERRRQMFELLSNLANLSHEMSRAAISNIGRA